MVHHFSNALAVSLRVVCDLSQYQLGVAHACTTDAMWLQGPAETLTALQHLARGTDHVCNGVDPRFLLRAVRRGGDE